MTFSRANAVENNAGFYLWGRVNEEYHLSFCSCFRKASELWVLIWADLGATLRSKFSHNSSSVISFDCEPNKNCTFVCSPMKVNIWENV